MESPNSLVGLITQMQHLENSIASIVFEMVLKLSSLTDANMFLLIENGEGRRFGGKRQLCDAYLQGALMSLGGETEVGLNPTSQALHFRHIDGADPHPPHPYALNRAGGVGHGGAGGSGGVSGLCDGDMRGVNKEKSTSSLNNSFLGEGLCRKRNYDDGGGGGGGSSGGSIGSGHDFPTQSKAAKMFNPKTSPELATVAPVAINVAGERPEDLSRSDSVAKQEVFIDEDGELLGTDDGGEGSMDRSFVVDRDMPLMCPWKAVGNNAVVEYQDSTPRPDPVSFANSIEELDQYFAVSDKVLAVKSIPIEKLKGLDSQSQSFEYKLFTSTLYDISKLAARCSPSYDKKNPSSKAHFHNVFERVWTEFSFLELLAQLGVQPKNGFSMRNFVRATMQKTYGHILDKQMSNSMKLKETTMAIQ